MVEKTIAVLEGDGIGPEIMREGLKVLDAVSKKYGHKIDLTDFFTGGNPFTVWS